MAELDLTAFYGQFRDEAWENLNLLEQGLTALEAQPSDTALLDRMLRAVHTTKGSAKIMGFAEINRLAHQIEEVLGAVRKGTLPMSAEVGTALLRASAGIRALTMARIEGRGEAVDVGELSAALQRLLGAPAAAPEAVPVITVTAPAAGRPRETMRVDLDQVDRLARIAGELLTLQEQAQAQEHALYDLALEREEFGQVLAGLRERLEAFRDRFRPRQAEEVFQRLERLEQACQRLERGGRDFQRRHAALLERFSLSLAELQQQVLTVRLVPIGTLFEIFPGVVRRVAGERGLEVALEVRGAEVELDRRVLDLLREPLLHLVRNALAHGIEPPEERMAQGKPRRGRIVLQAEARGRRVLVRVEDDGRGIDLERVRRVAVERGLLDRQQAREADEQTLLDLLFRPAFSTQRRADDLSGRGVGLDVVQATMRQLSGMAQVQTEVGRGTAVTMDVPLTLATIHVLVVEAGGQSVAIPTAAIRRLLRVRAEDVVPVEGRPVLLWEGHNVPLVFLAAMLGLAPAPGSFAAKPAVVVGEDGHPTALVLDRLLDEAEVLVQPLGEILGASPYFSAATVSGAGQVVPILDLGGFLTARSATPLPGMAETPAAPPREPPRVLLVEDAITTRELERSILEAAGYRVETAFDGQDALQKLERGEFEIILTDIEMPRMDGFELTERIRADPRWRMLPVVIITAWSNEEDRRRGLQVGAQAYIVKSRFDQSNLLETMARLLG